MGRPEDFDAEEVTEKTSTTQQAQQPNFTFAGEQKTKGRLYRDTSDKFIGGVCSGIAAYMNVGPRHYSYSFCYNHFWWIWFRISCLYNIMDCVTS